MKNTKNKSNQYFLIRLFFAKTIRMAELTAMTTNFNRTFRDGKVAVNYGHESFVR